jgi:hypothetical protein
VTKFSNIKYPLAYRLSILLDANTSATLQKILDTGPYDDMSSIHCPLNEQTLSLKAQLFLLIKGVKVFPFPFGKYFILVVLIILHRRKTESDQEAVPGGINGLVILLHFPMTIPELLPPFLLLQSV